MIINDTYIITGASSDIGIAFIKKLLDEHKKCRIFAQFNQDNSILQQLKSTCTHTEIIPYQCDLSSIDELEKWIISINNSETIPNKILHLAANRFEYMRIKDFDLLKLQNGLNIQVFTLARLLKEYLPLMKKQNNGKVVTMLSSYTLGTPPKFMSDYIIIKSALLGLVKSAANEYSGSVNVNAISPNMIETKFLSNIDVREIEMNAINSSMKRNVKLDEVISGIQFLFSQSSSYINGINLNLSGGDYM